MLTRWLRLSRGAYRAALPLIPAAEAEQHTRPVAQTVTRLIKPASDNQEEQRDPRTFPNQQGNIQDGHSTSAHPRHLPGSFLANTHVFSTPTTHKGSRPLNTLSFSSCCILLAEMRYLAQLASGDVVYMTIQLQLSTKQQVKKSTKKTPNKINHPKTN